MKKIRNMLIGVAVALCLVAGLAGCTQGTQAAGSNTGAATENSDNAEAAGSSTEVATESSAGASTDSTNNAEAAESSADASTDISTKSTDNATKAAADASESATTDNTQAETAAPQNSDIDISIVALSGPTGMGMAYLNKQSDDGSTAYKYNISYASAPDEVTGGLISGDIDIAAVPVNLASVLYNKTGGDVLTLAVNTLGVLYIVENGTEINSLSDLAGKKIVASGQGSTPEYILNYLLEQNGLTGQVEVEYVSEHDEAVTALANANTDIIMIPEPKVTAALSQIEGARVAVNLTEEWNKVSDTELVQGVLVVRKGFIDDLGANADAVIDSFMSEYEASVDFTNSNPSEASEIIAAYGIIPKAVLALKAIPRCNMVCMTNEEMENAVTTMLEVLFGANPKSVGGSLPGTDMFLYTGTD